MTYLVLRLLSVFCLTAFVRSEVKKCTQENVNKCTEPFQDMNITLETAIVPIHDEATVRKLCKNFDEMESCLKPMMPNCGTADQLYLQGLSDGYDYMCDETLEDYINKYLPCLKKPVIHSEGEICNTTWTNRLDSLKGQQLTPEGRVNKLCHYTNEYLDCVYNTVKAYCGEDAATWQRTLDERHLKPLLCKLGCDFVEADNVGCSGEEDSPLSGNNLIILSVAMAICLLLLIPLAVFAYIYYQKQKKRRSHRRERHSVVYVNSGNGVQAYVTSPGVDNPTYTQEKNGMPPSYATPYAVPYQGDMAMAQPPPYETQSEYNKGAAVEKPLPLPPPSEARRSSVAGSVRGGGSVAGSRRSSNDARSTATRY